jgi:hypothetical protein
MSAWAALVERARLRPGETVLVNGANGTAGRLAVQLAKHLGAGRVIGTACNEAELQELKSFGADLVPFAFDAAHPFGARQYEEALVAEFSHGIDVAACTRQWIGGDRCGATRAAAYRHPLHHQKREDRRNGRNWRSRSSAQIETGYSAPLILGLGFGSASSAAASVDESSAPIVLRIRSSRLITLQAGTIHIVARCSAIRVVAG